MIKNYPKQQIAQDLGELGRTIDGLVESTRKFLYEDSRDLGLAAMHAKDAADLQRVVALLRVGEFRAATLSMRELDSACRDLLPRRLYEKFVLVPLDRLDV
ncbi:MAG: hypothetical protein AAF612_09765 [Planctomycetota bacterium]